jgi:hypothetical protein
MIDHAKTRQIADLFYRDEWASRENAIAAAARGGETTQLARSEGPQSGGVKQPHRPNTGGHST